MKSSARRVQKTVCATPPAKAEEMIGYGVKLAQAGFATGAGGCVSLLDNGLVWIKPAGLAMTALKPGNLCGIDLATGKRVYGKRRPAADLSLHLAVYRARPDISAVFQARPPWTAVAVDSGLKLKAMFAEFVNDLGRAGTLPFAIPRARTFAGGLGAYAADHDTIFMVKRGVLAVGVTMKQAFFRIVVTEDAAKSLIAAVIAGKPKYFTRTQIDEILSLDAVKHRTKMVEKKS